MSLPRTDIIPTDAYRPTVLEPRTAGKEELVDTDAIRRLKEFANFPDTYEDSAPTFAQFVAYQLRDIPANDMAWRAVRSLRSALPDAAFPARLEATHLSLWIATMIADGRSATTRRRYFERLHTLFVLFAATTGAGVADDPFAGLRTAAEAEYQKPDPADTHNADVLRRIYPLLDRAATSDAAAAAVVYTLLTASTIAHAATTILDEVENASDATPQLIDFARRMRTDSRRRYLLPLQQNRRRLPQITRQLTHDIASFLTPRRVQLPEGFTDDTIKSIWIVLARRAGITLTDIRAVITTPPVGHAYLNLLTPTALTDEQRANIMRRVADTLSDYTPRWHVLHLRRNVAPADIIPLLPADADTYYPTQRMAERRDGRLRFTDQPILPGILFVRIPTHRVAATARAIGAQAWFYRTVNTTDAPYSVIPAPQMMMFQRAVGQLTPDIAAGAALVDPSTLPPGTRVPIIAGPLAGHIATITSLPHYNVTTGAPLPQQNGSTGTSPAATADTATAASTVKVQIAEATPAEMPDMLDCSFTLALNADTAILWRLTLHASSIAPLS